MKIALLTGIFPGGIMSGVKVYVGADFEPNCCGCHRLVDFGFTHEEKLCSCCDLPRCCFTLPKPQEGDEKEPFWRLLDRAITKGEWGYMSKPWLLSRALGCAGNWWVMMDLSGEANIREFLGFARCCGVDANKELISPSSNFWKYIRCEVEREVPALCYDGLKEKDTHEKPSSPADPVV